MALPTALFRTLLVALCAAVLAFAPARALEAGAPPDAMARFVTLD